MVYLFDFVLFVPLFSVVVYHRDHDRYYRHRHRHRHNWHFYDHISWQIGSNHVQSPTHGMYAKIYPYRNEYIDQVSIFVHDDDHHRHHGHYY